jgi:glycosyltransferase involved in cell wall biosynthesis
MTRVLLLHGGTIPHYRIAIYGYLSGYLRKYDFDLTVLSSGIQSDNPHAVDFCYLEMPLSALNIAKIIYRRKIDVIIMFVDMRHLYLFPTYLIAKGLLRRKMVWWGQGRDLADRDAVIKNIAYAIEHALSDSIILYAEHLKKYLSPRFYKKTFVANNTLVLSYPGLPDEARGSVLTEHGIPTKKNIICVGRLQKRKRLEHLVSVHAAMNRPDIGLIFVGPDVDGVLADVHGENIYTLGPIYGAEKFDLLSAADVYCLPGAVGLSIVDAFHCGLPIVTEEGDESAEMMYLKHGRNGFIVPRGDIPAMTQSLLLLLDNDSLRRQFSDEARKEIEENGSIERLCSGFRDALQYASTQTVERPHGRPAQG